MTDQTNKDLPPLPTPVNWAWVMIQGEREQAEAQDEYFTAKQMHAYARAALSASAPTTAPIEALSSECNECGGTGLRDLGGFYPWGEPTMIECDCISKMPTPNAPAAGSVPSDEEIQAVANSMRMQPWGIGSRQEDAIAYGRTLLAQYGSPAWQPIETAPKGGREMFVVKAFNVTNENCHVRNYTSDPYCVWPGTNGGWVRWPHPFPPTHWMAIPTDPQEGK